MPTLRPYRSGDWSSFLELDLETGLASIDAADAADFKVRWPELLRKVYGWSEGGPTIGNHTIIGLEDNDGSYAGHLWISEREDFFTGRPEAFVTTVAVVATHRGRGFGKLLMNHAIEFARSRGLARIGLGVEAHNAGAIKLYEKLGFRTARLSMEMKME